jgi:hypothetical protein
MALALGDPIPEEVIRWRLAEQFGWSLEYIDNLSIQDMIEYISIIDGRAHANQSIIKR